MKDNTYEGWDEMVEPVVSSTETSQHRHQFDHGYLLKPHTKLCSYVQKIIYDIVLSLNQ
jgi:hypothetical protein